MMIRAVWSIPVFACLMALAAASECGPGGCDETADMKVSMLQKKGKQTVEQNEASVESLEARKAAILAELEDLDVQLATTGDEKELGDEEQLLETTRLNESSEETLDGSMARKGGHQASRGGGNQYNNGNNGGNSGGTHNYGRWDTKKLYPNTRHLTVYHQTSPEICKLILASNFRIGKGGWCGKAAYFAMSPKETSTKAITAGSHGGCMIEAVVDAGNVLFAQNKDCNPPHQRWNYMTNGWKGPQQGLPKHLKEKGNYDSIIFHLGDGDEMIIYDPDKRVLSKKIIPFKHEWKVKYHQR